MTFTTFVHQLTEKDSVPFVPTMSEDSPPELPEGTIVPVTEEVYYHFLELQRPRFMRGSYFVFAEGENPFCLFWKRGGDYFGLALSEEESNTFCQFAGIKRGD
jgi:hypothetical protein